MLAKGMGGTRETRIAERSSIASVKHFKEKMGSVAKEAIAS